MSLYEERSVFPANTFEAIQYSVDVLGAEGIEIDIQMTKDCVLVLYHDAFITTSPQFNGCISDYNWDVVSGLKHNNSKYGICRLDTVLNYLIDRKVKIYLDLKPYSFCNEANRPLDIFASSIDSMMLNFDIEEKALIIAGSLNRELLKNLNTLNKCIEAVDVDKVLKIAEQENFQYVMLPIRVIDENTALRLIHSPFKWGVFGGKSNGEIRQTIAYKPDCFISDNVVFTQKITK
jgi:glycerophosphoryl diester phosphodiesterase